MDRHPWKAIAGLLAVVATLFLASASAGPIYYSIGPGDTYPGTEVDTASQWRINVERDPVHLEEGRYLVLDFSMRTNNASGHVTPFLLTLVTGSPRTYEVIWLGPQFDPPGSGVQTDTYVGGLKEFYLPAAADVYAGFFQNNNLVYLNTSAGSTDHDNSVVEPTYVGETVGGFGHPDLRRTYAFEVNVEYIPRPATMSLLTLGGLALLRRRRKASGDTRWGHPR